jgi:UDP-N-acetylglucosamine transferase subunit ALG13
MILVTTGTNEQPFDRLVRAAARLRPDEPLVVQHGASLEPHGVGTWVEMMPFEELSARMTAARMVVSHAGVGSIMLARRCGKVPIVMPRRVGLGEAVDDHQVPLARRLHALGMVVMVEDEEQLERALAADSVAAGPRVEGDRPLAAELRLFFHAAGTPLRDAA